jgi:cytochrome c-type biogenesis protein CcmF
VAYVYQVINSSMPLYLKVTALWGGQNGSLLFWCWLMAGAAFIVMLRNWKEDRPLLPWVIVVTMVTLAFFLSMTIFAENAFYRFWTLADGTEVTSVFQPAGATPIFPYNGVGLNPLLRHPAMIIHPPALYLGFVLFVIPFAFAIASLITGQKDDRWIALTHRWTLTAWLFLSAGLLLGMWWAYGVLGWGGYWGWDPVEIAALMPWLSGTTFLHSAIILERRDLARRWTVFLIMLTYALVILGTFLTRSGLLSSVHAFAESNLGVPFFIFLSLTLIGMFGLFLYRWNDLESHGTLTSLLSRESMFIINNLLIMGVLAVCLWGVLFPIVSEWITGQSITVGPPFYERAAGPLFAGLLLLMGIVPLAAWGRSTLKTLGSAIWKPLAAALVLLAIAFALGVRQWPCWVLVWRPWRAVSRSTTTAALSGSGRGAGVRRFSNRFGAPPASAVAGMVDTLSMWVFRSWLWVSSALTCSRLKPRPPSPLARACSWTGTRSPTASWIQPTPPTGAILRRPSWIFHIMVLPWASCSPPGIIITPSSRT